MTTDTEATRLGASLPLESTLQAVACARRYQGWLSEQIAGDLEPPVLEIGAGLGGFTEALIRLVSPVLVSEPDPALAERLDHRLGGDPRVVLGPPLLLPLAGDPIPLDPLPSTVVLANVLEHIEDDQGALASVMAGIPSARRLVLIVPAHQWAYSPVDRSLGHFRRYSTGSLREALTGSGWDPVRMAYFNPLGALAWAVSGKVLRRSSIEPWHARVVETLLPGLRVADRLGAGRWLGQSVVAVASR